MTPEVIGRYEIIEELGRGAMGSVFKARDPAVGRTVAVKTIHTTALEGSQSEEYRMRFHREARASGVLSHPGIVPVFDVGEDRGTPFLVMEFVDGRTLGDAIKKGDRFTLDRVCEIGQQIAEALGYAHHQGVIHRDIKPANILLTSREVYGTERPRITDFGIAKLAASDITTTGQLLGTPSFMPPEQFTGAPIDGRADLFSLGVILYSLATGEQPFPGETMTAVSYKVVHTEPIPPSKLNPAIPPNLEGAILKCLAKNPAARYQTGEEIARDLAAIRNAAVATHPAAAPPAQKSDVTLGLGPAPIATPASASAARPKTPGPAMAALQKLLSKSGKPLPFETVFALGLLSVAAFAAIVALTWVMIAHHLSMVALEHRQALNVPSVQPAPAPPSVPQPQTTAPPAQPETEAAPTAETQAPSPKATPAPDAKKPAETGPAPTKPALKKPNPGKPASAPPSPAAATPAVAAPVVGKATPPSPAGSSTPTAAAGFDPRKLDPKTSAKLKIDLSRVPNGLPYVVQMNGKVYFRGITGEKTDLDNLYVPAGVQKFSVSMKSGGQQKASNVVSQDFKAKRMETLRIELTKPTNPPSGSAGPLAGDARIVLSLVSGLSVLGIHL
jgi:serine/threonine-protein kinase